MYIEMVFRCEKKVEKSAAAIFFVQQQKPDTSTIRWSALVLFEDDFFIILSYFWTWIEVMQSLFFKCAKRVYSKKSKPWEVRGVTFTIRYKTGFWAQTFYPRSKRDAMMSYKCPTCNKMMMPLIKSTQVSDPNIQCYSTLEGKK